jgi:hypothetical protein
MVIVTGAATVTTIPGGFVASPGTVIITGGGSAQ